MIKEVLESSKYNNVSRSTPNTSNLNRLNRNNKILSKRLIHNNNNFAINQTKKLLRKSVVNLNNRKNRIESINNSKVNVDLNDDDQDCIILDVSEAEIIVLDDDGDQIMSNVDEVNKNEEETSHNTKNDSLNKCNTLNSTEEPNTLSSCQTNVNPQSSPECSKSNLINAENIDNSESNISSNHSIINISDSLKSPPPKSNANQAQDSKLFFTDKSRLTNNNNLSVPYYRPIHGIQNCPSDGTRIVKFKNQTDDDSVIFVGESINLEPVNKFIKQAAKNFIPISRNEHIESYKKIGNSPPKNNKHIESYKRALNSPETSEKLFKKIKYSNTSTPKFNVNKRLLKYAIPNSPKFSVNTIPSPPKFSVNKRLLNPTTKNNLLSVQELAQNSEYSTNTYNPNKQEENKSTKRMVIIDGSNVAYAHALSKNFSVEGLEICIAYFVKMGHEVKAVVPQFRLQKYKSSNPNKLEELHKMGKIVFTPCKNLPGKSSSCYDDRFILQLAVEFDAAIVSNDNYRDLLNENIAFKKIIEHRVIGYTWCNDMFILPKDPYGKNGPPLSVILNRV